MLTLPVRNSRATRPCLAAQEPSAGGRSRRGAQAAPVQAARAGTEPADSRIHRPRAGCYCPVASCGKWLCRIAYLPIHMRVHTGEKPWACPVIGCSRRFAQQANRHVHMRTHRKEKPHPCPAEGCQKLFSQKSDMMRHQTFHASERPWPCPSEGCTMRFLHQSSAQGHMRSHHPPRLYSCPVVDCRKRFSRRSGIAAHLPIHSAHTPYACPFEGCNKRFRTPPNLQFHLGSHNRKMLYRCTFGSCEREFRRRRELKTHLGRHQRPRPEHIECLPVAGPCKAAPALRTSRTGTPAGPGETHTQSHSVDKDVNKDVGRDADKERVHQLPPVERHDRTPATTVSASGFSLPAPTTVAPDSAGHAIPVAGATSALSDEPWWPGIAYDSLIRDAELAMPDASFDAALAQPATPEVWWPLPPGPVYSPVRPAGHSLPFETGSRDCPPWPQTYDFGRSARATGAVCPPPAAATGSRQATAPAPATPTRPAPADIPDVDLSTFWW